MRVARVADDARAARGALSELHGRAADPLYFRSRRRGAAPSTRRCLVAKGQVNAGKSNKPKLTAKQKQAKRAEKRAAKNK